MKANVIEYFNLKRKKLAFFNIFFYYDNLYQKLLNNISKNENFIYKISFLID